MSGLTDIAALSCVVADCPLYNSQPFFAPIFILIDYFPTYVTVILYVISFYSWELYFAYVSLCLFIDWGVNILLRIAIAQPQRFPGCGSSYGMPSFSSEQAILLNTLGLTLVLLWSYKTSALKIAALNVVTVIVILARVYIGSDTRQSVIVGGVVGFIEGIIFTLIFYYFRRLFVVILELSIIRNIGVVDNMCNIRGLCYEELKKNKQMQMR